MTAFRKIVCGIVLCSFAGFGVQSALAEEMSKDQMVKSLKAKPSFKLQARAAEKARLLLAARRRAACSRRRLRRRAICLLAIASSICA